MTDKTEKIYHISGNVLNRQTRAGLAKLRVEAWDKDLIFNDLVGSAETDSAGAFVIRFDESYFAELFLDREPDLFFRVYQDEKLVKSTEDSVLWNVAVGNTKITIEVDLPEGVAKFLVYGIVRAADDTPVAGVLVRAIDRDLPSLNRDGMLGETRTDANGSYKIDYMTDQFSRAEKDGADLLVVAYGSDSEEIGRSAINFNAPREAEINLLITRPDYRGLSEFERILAALTPLVEGISIGALSAEDVTFLAHETSFEARTIGLLVIAHRHAEITNIQAAIFYGLIRQNLPLELPIILAQSANSQRTTLERSARDNIIPILDAGQLSQVTEQLKKQRVQLVLYPPNSDQSAPLSAILSTTLPNAEQQTFMARYLDHQGDPADFWESLRKHSDFSEQGLVDKIQFSLQLDLLTDGNTRLVQLLREDQALRTTRDLIHLDAAAWRERIAAAVGESADGIPEYIRGDTSEEKITNYAGNIIETLKSAFPTPYVALGLEQAPAIDTALVRQVLELNADLDLQAPLPENLNWGELSEEQQATARQSLRLLQGEIAMFPALRKETVLRAALKEDKFDNSLRHNVLTFMANAAEFDFGASNIDRLITDQGEQVLAGIDPERREDLRQQLRAIQRVYAVTPRYEEMSILLSAGINSVAAISSLPADVFAEDFAGQLGSVERALQLHGRAETLWDQTLAVFGAAVSNQHDVPTYVTGRSVMPESVRANYANLFDRISLCDCEHCRSVYSPAAYFVDLLHFLDPSGWNQWRRGAPAPINALLRRRPDLQHIALTCENTNTFIPYIDLVNEILETYIVYQRLPSDQATGDTGSTSSAELLANPQYVNISAYDALKGAVYPLTLPFNYSLEVARVYLEHLGTSLYEVMKTVQRARPPSDAAELAAALEYLKISLEEHNVLINLDRWSIFAYYGDASAAQLANAVTFLARTGITYANLAEILKTRFINPTSLTAATAIILADPNNHCDPADRVLRCHDGTALDDEAWDRLQRFIRLWHKLGWPIQDVDRTLHALAAQNAAGFTSEFLKQLGQTAQLKDDLGLPLAETLSLWADLDTLGDDELRQKGSLYAGLFLNRTVRSLAASPDAFDLNDDGNQLRHAVSAEDNRPAIMAALRVGADDLTSILAVLGLGNMLNLAAFSRLHRFVILARTLRISIRDLLTLRTLSGNDIFAEVIPPANSFSTLYPRLIRFICLVRKLQRSDFTVAMLDYLYRHHEDVTQAFWLQADKIDERLDVLRIELRQVRENAGTAGNETEPAQQEQGIDQAQRNVAIQSLAEAFSLDRDKVEALLNTALKSPAHPAMPILNDFIVLRDRPDDPQAPDPLLENARQAFVRLSKAALFVSTFKMTAVEIVYMTQHPDDFAHFNLNDLPLTAPADAVAQAAFASWERLYDLATFRNSLAHGSDLVTVFQSATSPSGTLVAINSVLVTATGWDEAAIVSAVGSDGLAVTNRNFYRNEQGLIPLADCLALSRKIGIAPAHLFAWATNTPNPVQVREVQSAVKAKYDETAWLAVARTLNDPLREKQRDALVAYILSMNTIRVRQIDNANELYEYFLIDVEMNACMATSRIKQAISSVQLFIQRCFLNLEPQVRPNALRVDHWRWMRNYRVWEANRKVFLYAENWLEPELRDDKSSFFKELENELLQNDVTDETAEAALLTYLDKLDEVAQLDIRAIYWEHEGALDWDSPSQASSEDEQNEGNEPTETVNYNPANRADILHVFARTRGDPHVYYYRRLLNHSTWTAWEKLQASIEGEHLIPVVYNRRLYLFWVVFQESTVPTNTSAPSNTANLRPNRLEIKLAWSEYKSGKWSPKKMTPSSLQCGYFPPSNRLGFFFDPREDDGNLIIRCTYTIDQSNLHGYIMGDFIFSGCDNKVTIIPGAAQEVLLNSNHSIAPPESHPNGQMFISQETAFAMRLTTDIYFTHPDVLRRLEPDEEYRQGKRNRYSLLFSRQIPYYDLRIPLFYQDHERSYFITPEQVADTAQQLREPDAVQVRMTTLNFLSDPGPAQANRAPALSYESGFLGLLTSETTVQYQSEMSSSVLSDSSAQSELAHWTNANECVESPSNPFAHPHTATPPATHLKVRFHTFFHPHVCGFIRDLKRQGIPGLFSLEGQQRTNDPNGGTLFQTRYDPAEFVDPLYPKEDVDFDGGAYALYNWELFFHIPLLIALRLAKNQRFDESRRWFHYIFDPTTNSADTRTRRFWKALPFYRHDDSGATRREQISNLLYLLSYQGSDIETQERKAQMETQVQQWRDDPFNPHRIARLRLTTYQKNVVMKYIDTLIAWGDQLFNQDTLESINEATQLYVLAYLILGERPQFAQPEERPEAQTYHTLRPHLDSFSNALVATENTIPGSRCASPAAARDMGTAGGASLGTTLYFCIPPNEKLLSYWDLVEDRLFKIRNCMNIDGTIRQLPLFEPPIDPGLLVRARAAGLDLRTVLTDLYAPPAHYRFTIAIQKALELCAELRSLGSAFLAALEKHDAEELALLRSTHEIRLLQEVRQVREKQIEDAQAAIDVLQEARALAQHRRSFYQQRIRSVASTPSDIVIGSLPLNIHERDSIVFSKTARDYQLAAGIAELVASVAHALPDFIAFIPKYGGSHIGWAAQSASKIFSLIASEHTYLATNASTMATYIRRAEEWQFQQEQAAMEIEQITKQDIAAQIKLDIAGKELHNHDLQIENATVIDSYLRSRKFTRMELYDWMTAQLSAIYFQTYQFALDLAKRAEGAYRFERGLTTSNFVRFDSWDSLKKGLLAGEKLYYDLKRLETAYMTENQREYEITKHISLVLHDPLSLMALKTTGQCVVQLPEALFDADYPGHFMRRIKTVSMTIPAVVGPYTNINCTLTLLRNTTRINPTSGTSDDNFKNDFIPQQSIVTSHAQNDSGMFELNFRDERYLPFEGAGVDSVWTIEMPKGCNAFDFDCITDVVMRISYTARRGSTALANAAREALHIRNPESLVLPDQTSTQPLRRMFSLKHEFATEWFQFLQSETPQTMSFNLTPERFPFQMRGRTITIHDVTAFVLGKHVTEPFMGVAITLTAPPNHPGEWSVAFTTPNVVSASSDGWQQIAPPSGLSIGGTTNSTWSLLINGARIVSDQIADIFVVFEFTAS